MNTRTTVTVLGWMGCLCLASAAALSGCSSSDPSDVKIGKVTNALGNPGGAQACVVGTNSLRIAQRVTTSGGLACDSLSMESAAKANGGANINNVGAATVRISGATINGPVGIAGAAPSAANGELINGGVINGTVTTGAGLQAVLPTHAVTPGTTSVTVNSNDAPRTLAPGAYAAVTTNGSTLRFTAGTYSLASLTINAGTTVNFDTSGGPITIDVLGTITVNGGVLSAGDPSLVTLYSNSSLANAVTLNAGITTFPGTITAPNGGLTVGSRIAVAGCVGAKDLDIEPDSRVNSVETLTVPTDGTFVSSQFEYPAGTTVTVRVSGLIVWGGCDRFNCPDAGSCNFIRLGDAQFHSDNCFTGPDPTFHSPAFNFPIQLFMNGGPLPTTPFSPDHVYTVVVPGNDGHFVFNYSDIPGTYPDNSGSFTVTISAQ